MSLVSMNTADMLTDLGHSVLEASSAADALQRLASGNEFDVIVTDYAMPGMNGLDLATEIKRINPSCRSFSRPDMRNCRRTRPSSFLDWGSHILKRNWRRHWRPPSRRRERGLPLLYFSFAGLPLLRSRCISLVVGRLPLSRRRLTSGDGARRIMEE